MEFSWMMGIFQAQNKTQPISCEHNDYTVSQTESPQNKARATVLCENGWELTEAFSLICAFFLLGF